MQFHDLFCHRKSKSGSSGLARSGIVRTVELFKYGLQFLFRDRLTLIRKYDDNGNTFPVCTHINVCAAVTIGNRISQKVVKHPGKFVRITFYHKIFFRINISGQIVIGKHGIKFIHDLLQHQWKIDGLFLQTDILEIELCDLKKFADQFT